MGGSTGTSGTPAVFLTWNIGPVNTDETIQEACDYIADSVFHEHPSPRMVCIALEETDMAATALLFQGLAVNAPLWDRYLEKSMNHAGKYQIAHRIHRGSVSLYVFEPCDGEYECPGLKVDPLFEQPFGFAGLFWNKGVVAVEITNHTGHWVVAALHLTAHANKQARETRSAQFPTHPRLH